MSTLVRDLATNRLNWLLVFVPAVLVVERIDPESHTVLFLLSVLAIVPLAGLLSHATEGVAAKTGDAIGACSTRRSATSPNWSLPSRPCARACSIWSKRPSRARS